jgi:ATP:ADP antiporter, AAA family
MLNFRRGELRLAVMAALFYFAVLCGYFFLRPVREAMGVSRGMDQLRWLFVLTSMTSLAFVLGFGGVVSRTNRRRFIPIAYLFITACLVAFSGLLIFDILAGGGHIGTASETLTARGVGYTFYVWLSVINLFVNSLFWAYMADLFTVEQGKRMFPFIGIGGTLGAIVGGSATNQISGWTSSRFLPAGLMLTGGVLFAVAVLIMLSLDRMAGDRSSSAPASMSAQVKRGAGQDRAVGGAFWEGITALARSPYLLGIGAYIVFLAISNTMIYFTQANIMLRATDTFSERVAGFAQFDMLAQIATLVTQMFVTTHLIRRLGVGWTLAILPLVTLGGFAVLAVWPIFGVMAIFQALHRATRYAVSRPARETLFSVVPPAEKYKSKTIIDVFLYRGGDVAGAGIDAALNALGLALAWIAASTVPLAAVWGGLSVALGRAQQRRAVAQPVAPTGEQKAG